MGKDLEGTGGDFEGGVGEALVGMAWLEPAWSHIDVEIANVQRIVIGKSSSRAVPIVEWCLSSPKQ
jgi:hypothetical protein